MLISQLITIAVLGTLDPLVFNLNQTLDPLVFNLNQNVAFSCLKWFFHCVCTTLAEAYVQGSDNVVVSLFSVAVMWISHCDENVLKSFHGFVMPDVLHKNKEL